MRYILKAAAVAVAALTLSGCGVNRAIKDGMSSLVGQPASAAIAKLGYPTEDRMVAGRKVYVWSVTSFSEGTSYNCRIRAVLGANDIIESWDYENDGGCNAYARRLEK